LSGFAEAKAAGVILKHAAERRSGRKALIALTAPIAARRSANHGR